MKNYVAVLFCISTTIIHGIFEYDRAVHSAQKGEWAQANERFKSLVTAHPDRSDILYDAGVAAFNNVEYEQAQALFESVLDHEQVDRELKERARHNYETVKKILAEQDQKRQQEQQQNQSKDEQQQQDNADQDKQQQNDQSKNNDQKRDEQQKDQQQDEDNSSCENESNPSEQHKQEDSKQEQGTKNDGSDEQRDQKDNERDRPQEEERKPERQQQRRRRNGSERKPQENKQQEQQQKSDHTSSPEKDTEGAAQAQQQDRQAGEKEQALAQDEGSVQLDPALERVLARREDRDAQLNKQVVKALVGEASRQDGKNSW